jgi:hypothetical protein
MYYDISPLANYLAGLNKDLAARHRQLAAGTQANTCGSNCAVRTAIHIMVTAASNAFVKGHWDLFGDWQTAIAKYSAAFHPCARCRGQMSFDCNGLALLFDQLNVRLNGPPAKVAKQPPTVINVAAPEVKVEPKIIVELAPQPAPIVNILPNNEPKQVVVTERDDRGNLKRATVA